jgi:hypothetical protein
MTGPHTHTKDSTHLRPAPPHPLTLSRRASSVRLPFSSPTWVTTWWITFSSAPPLLCRACVHPHAAFEATTLIWGERSCLQPQWQWAQEGEVRGILRTLSVDTLDVHTHTRNTHARTNARTHTHTHLPVCRVCRGPGRSVGRAAGGTTCAGGTGSPASTWTQAAPAGWGVGRGGGVRNYGVDHTAKEANPARVDEAEYTYMHVRVPSCLSHVSASTHVHTGHPPARSGLGG